MALFLGIDGGGSTTSCVVGDENSVLGKGNAGGSNVVRVGEVRAREALVTAISQACSNAGIAPSAVQQSCLGMAGAARHEISGRVRSMLSGVLGGGAQVVGDTDIAFEAAFGSEPGVIVIAGTGSIAWGRNAAGETARAGGWGHAVSDEGSGHWIGRSAITMALRAQDEGQNTNLLEAAMKFWNVTDFDQLIVMANGSPSPDFAALVPVLVAEAENHDTVASRALLQAGTELSRLAELVIHRLFPEKQRVAVAMCGGVLHHCALVQQEFCARLRTRVPAAEVNREIADPVLGALEFARKMKAAEV